MRTLNILRHLARWHDITYLCNVGPEEEDYVAPMRALGLRVETVPWRETPHYSAKFYFDLAANLCSRYPYTVAKDYHRPLRHVARRLAAENQFDFLVCDFIQMARNAAGLEIRPRILFQHNVEAQILRRHATNGSDPLRRWYMARQYRKMRRFEAQAGSQFDAVVAVSEQDRRVFEEAYGWKHVDCIDTAVDLDYFRPQATRTVADRLVFVGSLDWLANEDAVMYFAQEIWPTIRIAKPGATFQVVGRSPTRRISQLHGFNGISVAASVPDVRPYLAEAAAVVVPLRIGGGTRIKIFEAFAMGKPVVSTTIGAEGLPLVPGEHLLIADDPAGFARAVLSVLESPALAGKLGSQAHSLVSSRYSAETVARQFDVICRAAVSRVRGEEPCRG
jgi:glycosyltransferase involved in cell wall biosynthesis